MHMPGEREAPRLWSLALVHSNGSKIWRLRIRTLLLASLDPVCAEMARQNESKAKIEQTNKKRLSFKLDYILDFLNIQICDLDKTCESESEIQRKMMFDSINHLPRVNEMVRNGGVRLVSDRFLIVAQSVERMKYDAD